MGCWSHSLACMWAFFFSYSEKPLFPKRERIHSTHSVAPGLTGLSSLLSISFGGTHTKEKSFVAESFPLLGKVFPSI